jgi:hypothetical protein
MQGRRDGKNNDYMFHAISRMERGAVCVKIMKCEKESKLEWNTLRVRQRSSQNYGGGGGGGER